LVEEYLNEEYKIKKAKIPKEGEDEVEEDDEEGEGEINRESHRSLNSSKNTKKL
jgi:hypothetical protein